MSGQTVVVSVLADTKQFSRAFKNLSDETGLSKLGRMAKAAGKAVAVGLAAGTVALGAFVASAVGSASDLQQSFGGVDAVFKGNAQQVHEWAKSAAGDVGLSENAYNELAAGIGTQLKSAGLSLDEAGKKTNDLIGLSSDLAATFGGTTADAASALGSALRGEFDPAEKFGLALSANAVQAKALTMGFKKVNGQLSTHDQRLATLALIYDQTKDAQGQFSKQSNTLAEQQQILGAKFENIKATIGTYFLPAVTAAVSWLSDHLQPAFDAVSSWIQSEGIPALKSFASWWTQNVTPALQKAGEFITGTLVPAFSAAFSWIIQNRGVIEGLAVTIGAMVLAWQAYVKVLAIWKAAQEVATAVQLAFNVAMDANPIGLVILAITGLVAALTWFFTQTEAGKKAWAALQAAAKVVVDWFKTYVLPTFQFVVATIKAYMSAAGAYWSGIWSAMRAVAAGVWNALQIIVRTALGVIRGIIKTVTSLIHGDWSGAWQGIKDIFSSIFSGISDLASNYIHTVRGAFSGLKDSVVGVLKSAGDWLYDIGRDIINGLVRGIWSMATAPVDALKQIGLDAVSGVKSILGIHSPSRVFAELGAYTVAGLAQGLGDTTPVDNAMTALSGAVTDGYTPTPTNPTIAAQNGAGTATQRVYNINVTAGPGTDRVALGRELVELITEFERVNGGGRRWV
ncbi:hypothetical protein ACFT5B_14160 [Luteimicrobium sp. NPDC057192]|uniref:phage tail protein n=1 Tax=Luteimicrobium sp. NPDC057192 TaxID=3346042 RepID=UPI00362928A1